MATENQIKKQIFIQEHHIEWETKGKYYREQRQKLGISQKLIAESTQCSDKTIRRFEKGLPVQRRPLLEAAYDLAIKYIPLKRQIDAGQIDFVEKEFDF